MCVSFVCLFWDRVPLPSSGFFRTHYVAHIGLQLIEIHPSASGRLELKVCTTRPSLHIFLIANWYGGTSPLWVGAYIGCVLGYITKWMNRSLEVSHWATFLYELCFRLLHWPYPGVLPWWSAVWNANLEQNQTKPNTFFLKVAFGQCLITATEIKLGYSHFNFRETL